MLAVLFAYVSGYAVFFDRTTPVLDRTGKIMYKSSLIFSQRMGNNGGVSAGTAGTPSVWNVVFLPAEVVYFSLWR
jgi:hypothetical protein